MELLAIAWYMIIGFCIIMYVLLDGFDLGIGILFPLFNDDEKTIIMSTILPLWDGNQTWLVLGVACFYGAFPMAFSLVLPALYLPLLIMVIALLLRGISFEFRLKEKAHRILWNRVFFLSSAIVTFSQGILLGSFVQGFKLDASGNLIFHLLTPFNLTCGIALLGGYSLLGATWTISKTTGVIQQKMFKIARHALWMITFFLCVISLWSPLTVNAIWQRWFSPDNFNKMLFLPCFTAALIIFCDYAIKKHYEYVLYWFAVGIFICSYIGFGISTWPYLVPHIITMWQAAAPLSSQIFMLIGTLLLLPILLGYTFYAYYIFWEKVDKGLEY